MERRQFTREFKLEAVRLIKEGGVSAEKPREIVGSVKLRNDILLKSGKGIILARQPVLHQQSQLAQCRDRWREFDVPASRRRGGGFSFVCGCYSRLHEDVHGLDVVLPE